MIIADLINADSYESGFIIRDKKNDLEWNCSGKHSIPESIYESEIKGWYLAGRKIIVII